jgi:hypothetical protein
MRTKLFLTSIAALLLATGTAHADVLPTSIRGDYCWGYLNNKVFYKRGEPCSSNAASFSRTHYENARDVDCDFIKIKKVSKTVYRVQADCIDSHNQPRRFFTLFKLKILPSQNLLITYLRKEWQ